jgi:proton-coupled amino acid transporter
MSQPASASSSNFPSRTQTQTGHPSSSTSASTPASDNRPRARSVTEQLALGRKSPISMSEANQAKSSGLAARLASGAGSGTSPFNGTVPEPISRPGSGMGQVQATGGSGRNTGGASTPLTAGGPGESSFSNLADVPDEEKARVLGRHLMSARERRGSQSQSQGQSRQGTPYSPGVSPGASAGLGGASMRAEQSGMSRTSHGSLKAPKGQAGNKSDAGASTGNGSGKARDDNESAVDDTADGGGDGEYGAMGESFHIPYEAHGVDVT